MKSFSKLLLICLALTYSYNVSSITFEVVGPCNEKAEFMGASEVDLAQNVGLASIELFQKNKIPFTGSAEGMSSILNTPTGLEAIEVLSDTKMRAYGWCFSVNDFIPDVLSNEVFFTKQNDHLRWFYAYSTYDQGVWLDYCVPSYRIRAEQFCRKP
jgi:hypothetical protein